MTINDFNSVQYFECLLREITNEYAKFTIFYERLYEQTPKTLKMTVRYEDGKTSEFLIKED